MVLKRLGLVITKRHFMALHAVKVVNLACMPSAAARNYNAFIPIMQTIMPKLIPWPWQ